MESPPELSTVSLPTLDDILNQHDLDHDMFMYYLFTLKANDDAIYELTMRRNANNNETQNPIETQVDDPSPSTSSTSPNDIHSERVEGDMDDASSSFSGFSNMGPYDMDASFSGFSNSNATHLDDSSSADCLGCSSSNEGVPIGDNGMDGEGYISDSSSLGSFNYDDPVTPGGFYLGQGLEVPEYESPPEYDSDGIEVVPGHQLF